MHIGFNRKIANTLLLLGMALTGLWGEVALAARSVEPSGLWRENAPVIEPGVQPYSLIQDTGHLSRAIKDSKGRLLFSEVGAGIKPLVLVGTPEQLIVRITQEAERGTIIHNSIRELPNIYMGISPYVPKERFKAVYPLNDFANKMVGALVDYVPSSTIADAATNIYTFASLIHSTRKKASNKEFNSHRYYMKLSYLREDGMHEIGKGEVSFTEVTKMLKQHIANAAVEMPKKETSRHKKSTK